jgi:regulatory LuxR family protein
MSPRISRQISHDKQVVYRRDQVLEWTAQGKHVREIATALGVSEPTVKRDLNYLMEMAREHIKSYVQDRLPFEYMKSLATLDNIKKRAFEMADKAEVSDRDKIISLRLAAEAETSKARLLAEGPGVLAMQNITEKIQQLENFQFQEKLRQRIQIAR